MAVRESSKIQFVGGIIAFLCGILMVVVRMEILPEVVDEICLGGGFLGVDSVAELDSGEDVRQSFMAVQ